MCVSLQKFTPRSLVGSVEKGARTAEADMELMSRLVQWKRAQGYGPGARETCCTAWKCKNCLVVSGDCASRD